MIVRFRNVVVAILLLCLINPFFAWIVQQPSAFSRSSKRLEVLPVLEQGTSTTTSAAAAARWSSSLSSSSSADIEQPSLDETPLPSIASITLPGGGPPCAGSTTTSPISKTTTTPTMMIRSKINEIDYCIDPADVSLTPALRNSMTYALNDASNRVVRRILLARSWPSPEALNRSLMQLRAAAKVTKKMDDDDGNDKIKMRSPPAVKKSQPRSDAEYVTDQLQGFRDRYGAAENFHHAREYLECILALATRGIEPPDLIANVYRHGIYAEPYKRLLSVLKTVGVSFLVVRAQNATTTTTTTTATNDDSTDSSLSAPSITTTKQRVLAPKLKDLDICLSVMDKLRLQRQQHQRRQQPELVDYDDDNRENEPPPANNKEKKKQQPLLQRIFFGGGDQEDDDDTRVDGVLLSRRDMPSVTMQLNTVSNIVLRALLFGGDEELLVITGTLESDRPGFIQCRYPDIIIHPTTPTTDIATTNDQQPAAVAYLDALIALLRSCYDDRVITSLEPHVKLSNSYGTAYERLVATAVELGSGYFRPVSTVFASSGNSGSTEMSNNNNNSENIDPALPKPRNPQEELGRFAQWESRFRLGASSATDMELLRPNDLVGTWQVKDVVGGQTIGVTNVTFGENGLVHVDEPLVGRQWRLDPGPTHLDTCQFQVMTPDGNLLNYRGFIDRGARLEARFSGRPLRIRGSVMYEMRDGAIASGNSYYYKEYIIPINYRSGTTKFEMTKSKSR